MADSDVPVGEPDQHGRPCMAFPGQGVDPVATAGFLAEQSEHPLVRLVAELIDGVEITPRSLADTRVAQPCVVAAGLIASEGLTLGAVTIGHSLGEITACAHAGVMAPEAAVRLVARRAEIGIRVQAERQGAMVAVMRLDRAEVEWLRRLAVGQTGALLDLAVVNSERQVVLTGEVAAVDRLIDLAFEAGGKARRLGIGGAYHSPLLASAVDEFAEAVAAHELADPVVPVVCSTGPVLSEAGDVAAALGAALVRPVDWPAAVAQAVSLGATRVVDAGPGATLVNLADHFPSPPTTPLADEQ